jgi:2-iminoacetate synthase ThiH
MTLEAANVISMRLQMFCEGDVQLLRECELMLSEKFEAFARAGLDAMTGASAKLIRDNIRAAIQANEVRLKALRRASGSD